MRLDFQNFEIASILNDATDTAAGLDNEQQWSTTRAMNKNNERVLAFYTLHFKAKSNGYKSLPPYPHEMHLEWLIGAFNEDCCYTFSNAKKCYYIKQAENNDDHILLLVKYLDGYARDHVLEDINTRQAREIKKKEDEGRAFTSHIYISKQPVDGKLKMIIEASNGFTIGKISFMLNGLLKTYLKNHKIFITVLDPSGEVRSGKEVKLLKWPVMEARGTLSGSFSDELKTATIREVNLISSKKGVASLEDVDGLTEKSHVVKLKAESKFSRFSLDTFRRLASKNKKEFDEIVVTYNNEGAKDTTVHLECDDTLSPIDADRLVKKIIVADCKEIIKDAYDEIQADVRKAIQDHKDE